MSKNKRSAEELFGGLFPSLPSPTTEKLIEEEKPQELAEPPLEPTALLVLSDFGCQVYGITKEFKAGDVIRESIALAFFKEHKGFKVEPLKDDVQYCPHCNKAF